MAREAGTELAGEAAETGGPDRRSRPGGSGTRRLAGSGDSGLALLRLYYWATPLFFLADHVWGVSVRASFLPGSGSRLIYYGFCIACAVAIHRWPGSAPWVGMGESAVNLLLLVLGIMLPIYGLQDAVLDGGPLLLPLTGARLVNVLLTGTILIHAFHRNQRRIAVDGGRVGRLLAGVAGGGWREKG